MATLASGSTLYCSATEFLSYYDTRVVAELLSDTGTKHPAPASSTVLTDLLTAACGEVEASALRGGRYSATDLSTIADSGTFAGGHLKKLVATCVMNNLRSRRGRVGEDELQSHKWAEQHLKALRQGEEIFGVVEVQDAATTHSDRDDRDTRVTRSGISLHAQPFWGTRGGDRR
jgi:hypothetical protein